jgi:signal transduction histidine kinase
MASGDDLREQLESLHAISVEIAALHEMPQIHARALRYCRELTASEFAFTGLLVAGPRVMDVAAIQGFEPVDQAFYDRFHLMALRSSLVGRTIRDERPTVSNDVLHDPRSVGQPPGHPLVRYFLGVPLRVGTSVIGMIGVANKSDGYGDDDARILTTFANQVAVAIENARLYERQREMIGRLQQLHQRLSDVERAGLLARERRRIAGRLHDQIEQEVFSIGLGINTLLETPEIVAAAGDRLRRIRQVAVDTADEVRKAIFALSVPGHDDGDLTSDVRSLLRDLERRSGLSAHLVVNGTPPDGLEQVQDVLSSLVSETLTNVERHARAKMVLVSMRYDDERVDVIVQDDGVGIPDPILTTFEDSYLHFGLRHLREQVLELGGTLDVANGDEGGTIVRLSVPLRRGSL